MDDSALDDSTQLLESVMNESSLSRRGFLRAGAGVVATGLGIAAFSGQAAAHFPATLNVDIKPDSEENSINPNSHGMIPVAVLQSDEFDPTSEDVRYRFGAPDVVSGGGGARPAHDGHVEDIDGDGRNDLVLHFPSDETGFDGDESEGRLEWERDESGDHGYSGTDSVTILDHRSQ